MRFSAFLAAQHVVRVHRVEILFHLRDFAVAHDEQEMVLVLVSLAVLHLRVRFGLDRDAIAFGSAGDWRYAHPAINARSKLAHHSAELRLCLGSGKWEIARNPPGGGIR